MPGDLVDLPRLQCLHERKGSPRRALRHQPDLRNLRRQPRDLRRIRPEHGVRREAARPRGVDHQLRRGGRVHVRPQPLPGQSGRGGLLRADGARNQSLRARQGGEHAGAACGRARPPDHRGHHARAQPLRGRPLQRSAAHEQSGARDVLPDGRPARPSFHALSRRRGHRPLGAAVQRVFRPAHALHRFRQADGAAARRPLRLLPASAPRVRARGTTADPARLLGSVPESRGMRLPLPDHAAVGTADVRHSRHRDRRRAGHHRSGRDQPRHPHPSRLFLLRRLGGPGDVRQGGPAGQSDRSAPSLEPDHAAQAAEAGSASQVHLGHVAALARPPQRRAPRARQRRGPAGAPLGDGPRRQGRFPGREGDGEQREDPAAQDRAARGDGAGMEDPALVEHARARPRPQLLPGLRGGSGTAFHRSRAQARPRRRHADVE